jgi:bifunctional UDP-N-acetylglucosamine pyrophosphorylase/glucosamine-1-phosphate N-acetyltransferase
MKTACVILAAGMGKRMRSSLVKVLHPVCGQAMIDYPVELALSRKYDPVVVVVGTQAEAVEAHLSGRFGDRVRFAVQTNPAGTGHAVMAARKALKGFRGKLAILCGDVPLLTARDLSRLERAAEKSRVAFLTCRLADPKRYGRVVRDEFGAVERIVEYADASRSLRRLDEINTGIYLADCPFVFDALKGVGRANAQGEYYLTDLIQVARAKGQAVSGIVVEGQDVVLGVNDRLDLAKAEGVIRARLLNKLMARGVTVIDPASTWVGARVRIGVDSVLLPGCLLSGTTVVGKGCSIGPGAVIEDARVADGAVVKAYSVLEQCQVGRCAQVGPFARLRPGSLIEAEARVGNFVEIKKTRLGKGAKAGHLSYLGDADIGAGVNVGAGTITCNYDGKNKFRTVIGEGAFIGSDTQLVAPVEIGKGAYVGAGTTVTRNVPDEALAISRTRQRNIEGYARKKH